MLSLVIQINRALNSNKPESHIGLHNILTSQEPTCDPARQITIIGLKVYSQTHALPTSYSINFDTLVQHLSNNGINACDIFKLGLKQYYYDSNRIVHLHPKFINPFERLIILPIFWISCCKMNE